MISKDKDDKLIRIYFYICEKFEELQFYCERFSNNNEPEITDKGYCSTKGMYYYGMKLHMPGFRRVVKLPHPEQILFTPAYANDITVYKQAWANIENRTFFGDKI